MLGGWCAWPSQDFRNKNVVFHFDPEMYNVAKKYLHLYLASLVRLVSRVRPPQLVLSCFSVAEILEWAAPVCH